MWKYSKKAAICKPRRELSPQLNQPGTQISQPLDSEINTCCLSYPVYGILYCSPNRVGQVFYRGLKVGKVTDFCKGYHDVQVSTHTGRNSSHTHTRICTSSLFFSPQKEQRQKEKRQPKIKQSKHHANFFIPGMPWNFDSQFRFKEACYKMNLLPTHHQARVRLLICRSPK